MEEYERYYRTFSIERPPQHSIEGTHMLAIRLNDNQRTTVDLTQGELIDLWQVIGVYFNLAGMRDSHEAK